MIAKDDAIVVDGVRLTHPAKILYPEQGISKSQLASYYAGVADCMMPHVARRPLTLVRCPTGQQSKCFYQRHAGSGVPKQIDEIAISRFEESGSYLFLKDRAGLVALVQMGVLEIHPWGARVDRPDRPDRVIFDLDPGDGVGFPEVVAAAHDLHGVLQGSGLRAFVKTTGGKGVHIIVPIARRYEWREVKSFAKSFADRLAAASPERFLTRIAKIERRGRIFIDYLRNDPTSTAIAPYSTRARPGAPVATPLEWDELTPDLDPMDFTIDTVLKRCSKSPDPWREMSKVKQGLPAE